MAFWEQYIFLEQFSITNILQSIVLWDVTIYNFRKNVLKL